MNGADVTTSIVNTLSLVVPPMSSTMLTVPLSSQLGPGQLYTVVLIYAEPGSVPSVAGGRLAKTHFPIEAWPKSHECPYPTIKDDNYKVSAKLTSSLTLCLNLVSLMCGDHGYVYLMPVDLGGAGYTG